MSQNQELKMRCQFLVEAQAHLSHLAAAAMGLAGPQAHVEIDLALQTLHALTDGASAVKLQLLRTLAQRLEQAMQLLKGDAALAIDPAIAPLLLTLVDRCRWVVACDHQELPITSQWLTQQVEPLFEQLAQCLGVSLNQTKHDAPEQNGIARLFTTEFANYERKAATVILPGAIAHHREIVMSDRDFSPGSAVRLLAPCPDSLLAGGRAMGAVLNGCACRIDNVSDNAVINNIATNNSHHSASISADDDAAQLTEQITSQHLNQLYDQINQLTIAHGDLNLHIAELRQLINHLQQQIQRLEQKIDLDCGASHQADDRLNCLELKPASHSGNHHLFADDWPSHLSRINGAFNGLETLESSASELEVSLRPAQKAACQPDFTLDVVNITLAESNGLLLAFLSEKIVDICCLDSTQIIADDGNEWVSWQGDRVRLMRLDCGLVFNGTTAIRSTVLPVLPVCVLLVRHEHDLIGLLADRCYHQQTAASHAIVDTLPLPIGFSDCITLADGRVVPLVNVPDLLRLINFDAVSHSADFSKQLPNQLSALDSVASPAAPVFQVISELRSFLPTPINFSVSLTVLIVDDAITIRYFLALILEQAGYQVAQAEDGLAAWQLLVTGLPVAAILCDVDMPHLDGLGLLAKLKAQPQFAHLPVAMLTARDEASYQQRAVQLGAIAYLTKPCHAPDLLRTVAQMVVANNGRQN